MAYIGYQALNISLVLTGFATLLYFLSGKHPDSKYIKSAHRASVASFALISLASLALLYALYTRDFSIEYVASYTNRTLSWFYTGAAFWAGQAGSLLFWGWLLTIFTMVVLVQNRKKNSDLLPYAMGVLTLTTFFFNYLLVFRTSPFALLPSPPADGTGLNPLLQNPGMVWHPPSLYVGFVSVTVPFAFAIAALVTKNLEQQWVKSIRRWTLFAWLFLTIGNILGMQWAYVELGWGGYWAWDPVENSSLMPWLTATAFLHSIIVQERKGMLKRWTISLVVLTFALTIFGTFVTRSGLISSVHAFGVSNLGPLFLGFLALILVVSTFLIVKRSPFLEGKKTVGSWSSRETSFLLNNVLFAAITFGVFIGVVMPSLSELFSGDKLTVGAEFFNRMATPIGLCIFILLGLCAALSWGKTSTDRLLKNLSLPIGITLAGLVIMLVMGVRGALPLFAFMVTIFSLTTTIQDYIKSVLVHSKKSGTNIITAIGSLTLKHKRRYGGYIVHVGVLLFLFGIIGSSAFSIENSATLHKGDSLEIGNYNLVYQGITSESLPDRQVDTANFEVFKGDKKIGTATAEKHLHQNFQPATEVGIRSTLSEDLYIILADYRKSSEIATISALINPLVIWIWIGGIIMVLGTLVAISPDVRTKTV